MPPRVVSLVLVALTLLAACAAEPAAKAPDVARVAPAPPEPAPAPPETAPTPPVAPPPVVASPKVEPKRIAAWTDPEVIEGLAKSCAFRPEEAKVGKDDAYKYDAGILTCAGNLFEQSCVSDPCHDADQKDCKPKCEKTCNGCDKTCETKCEACKKPCTDEACKKTCATSCGECKQACLTEKDKCATGTCGQAYAACGKRLAAQWKAGNCPKACPKYNQCHGDCNESKDSDKCWKNCVAALEAACPAPLAGMCMFNGFGPGERPFAGGDDH